MSERFNLPLREEYEQNYIGEFITNIYDGMGDILLPCVPEDVDAAALVIAVEQHDKLADRVKQFESRLEKAQKSLTTAGFVDNGGEYWKPPVNKTAGRVIQNLLNRESELESLISDILCDYQVTASYAERDGLETEYAKLSAKAKELLK